MTMDEDSERKSGREEVIAEKYSCKDFCDFIALKVATLDEFPTSSNEMWRLGLHNVGYGMKQVIVFSRKYGLDLKNGRRLWSSLTVDHGGMDIALIPRRPICSCSNLLASIFVSMDVGKSGLYDDRGREIFPVGTGLENLAIEMDLTGWTPRSKSC